MSTNLSQEQISELITNIESADEESDWLSDGDTSDSELESESFTKIIREKLVSKLCSTQVNTIDSNTLSSQVSTSQISPEPISCIHNNISNDDPSCFTTFPEISISFDLDLIDIDNLPIFFNDNGDIQPLLSTERNDIDNHQNISNIFNAPMNVDESSNIISSNNSNNIPIRDRNNITKKNVNKNNTPNQVFSGQWNFDENVCSEYVPTQIKFNDASGVNVDVLDDLSPEFCEMDIFKIIFDEHLVQHIVDETNKFLHYVKKQHSKLNKWQETNVNEMYTFFALTFLMAHQKKNNMKDYWSTSPLLHSPIFGKIMTQDRYLILLRMLHFCDNLNQIPGNRLFKIETIVESLRMKFRSVFKPHQKICVDESIIEWKGRLKFKQYIPSKRHRFGIKLFVLCDCKTGFVLDFLVYTGTDQHIHFNESLQQSGSVISTLMEPYLNKGHIIYMDNWYSSPLLYQYLLENNTGACGTVSNKRKGMPTFPPKLAPGHWYQLLQKI